MRRRIHFTGEPHQLAAAELAKCANGRYIPDAPDSAAQFAESAMVHRLLHGAPAQWPAGAAPVFPLFVSAASPSTTGLRVVVPVADVAALGNALAMRRVAEGVRPSSDEIAIRRATGSRLQLSAAGRPVSTGGVVLQCSWRDLSAAVAGARASLSSGGVLRFAAGRKPRLTAGERAVLSGLLRRIALFHEPSALAWLRAWHTWLAGGRTGHGPRPPSRLIADLSDEEFGLAPACLHTLGLDVTPQRPPRTPLLPAEGAAAPARRPAVASPEDPLERHAADVTRLVSQLTAAGRQDGAVPARVVALRSAVGAEAVSLLGRAAEGFHVIDATARFDLAEVRHLLRAADGDPFGPAGSRWIGHQAKDGRRTLWCAPISRAGEAELVLAIVGPPSWLLDLGQAGAKILEALWRTDVAASPAEAEVQVLTALRETFGRLPEPLYERCFRLYREVLQSFRIVFQPIITIAPAAANVGVHSYEALARRSLDEFRAPVEMMRIAHVWGDRFLVERDKVLLRAALEAYAAAHAEGPWDLPKPVSVNASVRALLDDSYVQTLREAIAEASLRPESVTLSISERDPIEPHAYFHRRIVEIARDVGVAFAVDDFGTGYASLARMAELPLTQIKVDRAILYHRAALEELSLVVAVARESVERGETPLPRPVIVEGVDDQSPVTLRQIYERRIRHVQGSITGERPAPRLRPLPSEARDEIAARVRGEWEPGWVPPEEP